MAELRSALEMKDSGIEWVGCVPNDWNVVPIRSCFEEVTEKNKNGSVKNALKFTYGEIVPKSNFDADEDDYVADTIQNYYIVSPGTIMINGLNLNFDFITQRVGLVKTTGIITSAYVAVKPKDYNVTMPEYMNYLFKSYDARLAFHNLGGGVRKILNFSRLKSQKVCFPCISEQKNIVRYLDRKCSQIDEIIAEATASIEEYKELKQAVVFEAVTKGLDKNAPMKDSCIRSVGSIPAHWLINKMNRICDVITDYVASGSFASLAENVVYLDYPDYALLVRTADISGKSHTMKRVYLSKESYDFLHNSNLFGGEIILPNIGASVGDVYMVPKLYEHMTLAPNAVMLRTNQIDEYYYFLFKCSAGRDLLIDIAQSTAQAKFNKTELRQLRLPQPPIEEQERIVSYLTPRVKEIDSLIDEKQVLIDDLQNYKKSLIYEVVTGKKRVVS